MERFIPFRGEPRRCSMLEWPCRVGGHRATIWGLGVLLYLVDAGKHREVEVLSSVSGGSILNASSP
jgi:hypothetical protein